MSQTTHPVELKVKALSLAAEARIIRRLKTARQRAHAGKERETMEAARRAKNDGQYRDAKVAFKEALAKSVGRDQTIKIVISLEHHRRHDIRQAARTCHLARAFLKGQPYSEVEVFAYQQPSWDDIEKLAGRYAELDSRLLKQNFAAWLEAGKTHFQSSGYNSKNGARRSTFE